MPTDAETFSNLKETYQKQLGKLTVGEQLALGIWDWEYANDLPSYRAKQLNELADLMEWVLAHEAQRYEQGTWGRLTADELPCDTAFCLAGWYAGAIRNLHPTIVKIDRNMQFNGEQLTKTIRFFDWGHVDTEPFQLSRNGFDIMWMGLLMGLEFDEAQALFDEAWFSYDIPQALRNIGKGDHPNDVCDDNSDEYDNDYYEN